MTGEIYLPEIMGSGTALFDFDNDGDLDVFFVQGGDIKADKTPSGAAKRGRLFRNNLRSGEAATLEFTDVTEQSGIRTTGYGIGVIAGDINNDGFTDLYICNLGSNQLLLNKGDGTFTDATEKSQTDDPRWSIGGSFFDYDRDGFLDLFVLNYGDFSVETSPECYSPTTARDYCGPKSFKSVGNTLFRNKGDGTFENATVRAGINREFGHGLGSVAADFDADGWIDLYVANDGDPNQLWVNQRNGTFKNEALISGASVNRNGQAEASMGVDAGDADGNGLTDIFTTHLMEETHTLYLNFGELFFEDRTREQNIGMPGTRFTGFGTLFFDYDNDGWLDLFIANGSVKLLADLQKKGDPYPLGQLNQLFRNDGRGRFQDVSDAAGANFQIREVSRGAAFGDIDNDGDTDIIVTNNRGSARLLRNNIGAQNNWIGLRLIGKENGRDMLGAEVEIVVSEKIVLSRRVRTDGSYASAHDPRILAGIGSAKKIEKIRIRWPDGKTEDVVSPPINRYIELTQGFTAAK